MEKLNRIPNGIDEILSLYGDPDADGDFRVDPSWKQQHLRVFDLPYPLRLSWRPKSLVEQVVAHRTVGPAIMDALDEIGQYRGGAYLDQNQYNYFGGIFNIRLKRGGNELSTHSWAIAIDLNPNHGPLGVHDHSQPDFIVEAFERRGFIWGGRWHRPDAMHFQACKGY